MRSQIHQVKVSKRIVPSMTFLRLANEMNIARNAGTIKLLVSMIAVSFGPIFLMALPWKNLSDNIPMARLMTMSSARQSDNIFPIMLNGLRCLSLKGMKPSGSKIKKATVKEEKDLMINNSWFTRGFFFDLSIAFLTSIPSAAQSIAPSIPRSIPANFMTLNFSPMRIDGSKIKRSPETIESATPDQTLRFCFSLKRILNNIKEKIG